MRKDDAEHERNQAQGSGGDALLCLEACLGAARENPRALLGRNALEKERFCCLDLLLPPSSVTAGSLRVPEVALRPGGSPRPPRGRCAGLVSHSWLRQSVLQVKASFTSVNAERRSPSSFLSAADRR